MASPEDRPSIRVKEEHDLFVPGKGEFPFAVGDVVESERSRAEKHDRDKQVFEERVCIGLYSSLYGNESPG